MTNHNKKNILSSVKNAIDIGIKVASGKLIPSNK